MRARLEPGDRRCFAFFPLALPNEDLIFFEVSLTNGVAKSVDGLLRPQRAGLSAGMADTAVFYSISNCQVGLAGVYHGNSQIKQVATDLAAELAGLSTFVTLPPIPGPLEWAKENNILPPDPGNVVAVRQLAAHYLLNAKRADGLPFVPVARFHLGNDAKVKDVHAGADMTEKGLTQSAGAMVNYLYDLGAAAHRHEAFAKTETVAASDDVTSLQITSKKTPV